MSKKNEFLEKMACLCEQYDAALNYSHDDDGIHIYLGYEEIFCGFLHDEDASIVLRSGKDDES